MENNEYLPFWSEILEVIPHTELEYTFRMVNHKAVQPGQFFEVSIPKFGEAPISISGIGDGTVDLTIRRVGRVTNEIFERYKGEKLMLRGPYGTGFDTSIFRGRELVIVAGGTGVSPVRPVVEHYYHHPEELKNLTFIAGFRSPKDILFLHDYPRWEDRMTVILTVDNNYGDESFCSGMCTTYIPDIKINNLDSCSAIVVGPPAMMRFSTKALTDLGIKENNIWVSYERKMCCGIGKCGHCKIDDFYVCLDGPVVNYSRAKLLAD